MHKGCKCNVVIATCPQRYLESTFLRCHNVVITTLSQPKDNVVTTLSQRDFVCWVYNSQLSECKMRLVYPQCDWRLMMAFDGPNWLIKTTNRTVGTPVCV